MKLQIEYTDHWYQILRKRLGLAAIAAVAVIVSVLFVAGGVRLPDFMTQLAVGLSLLIPTIGYFTFKPEIDKQIHKKLGLTGMQNHTTQHYEKSIEHVPVKDGIYHYQSRTQFPFDEMISKAERRVEMAAITFTIVTISNYNILKGNLSRKVHLTCILLDPDSSSILMQSKIYHGNDDLKNNLESRLEFFVV